MTPEKVTIWVSVERVDDKPMFKMQATPALVNQLGDELHAQETDWGAVGSGELLFTVFAVLGGAGGVAGGTAAVTRALTGFLRRHDGKEITAHIGQGEGKQVTLKGYSQKDAVELLRLASEAAGTDLSNPPAREQVAPTSEEQA